VSKIVLDTVYRHPPERVWRALTDPQELAAWLMPNDFAPRVGHKFQFRDKPQFGWRGFVEREVLEVDPPRRLRYSWLGDEKGPVMTVTWTLEAVGGGTRLVLEHTGFRGLGGWFVRRIMGRGWGKKLRKLLPDVLDGKRVGPAECH